MPRTRLEFDNALAIEQEFQRRLETMSPDDPEWEKTARVVNKAGSIISEYESENRKVDDAGKVTAASPSRLPSQVGDGSGFNYHFEPSVSQAREALMSNPALIQQLEPGSNWTAISQQEKAEDVTDPTTGMRLGQNIVPARTHLDDMTDESSIYKRYADYVWEQQMKAAEERGTSLQRYRDTPLKDVPDFLAGGMEYNIDRRLAPFALGAADAFSMGQATPLLSVMGELADYELGQRKIDPSFTIGDTRFDPMPPSGEEVIQRSPGSYIAGSLVGSALPGNPASMIQEASAAKALATLPRVMANPVGRVIGSSVIGGVQNAGEGFVQDVSTNLSHGQGFGEAAGNAAGNIPLNAAMGAAGGGVFDAVAQVAHAGRTGLRQLDPRVKTLQQGGGDTAIGMGVVAPPEIREFVRRADDVTSLGSPTAYAVEAVAPHIEESIKARQIAERQRIEEQTNEYFNHPAYRDVTVNAGPLVDDMLNISRRGNFRGPVTGAPRNVDPEQINRLAREMNIIAEPQFMPLEQARQIAGEHGGRIISLEESQRLFGKGDDQPGGWVGVVVPADINANILTQFERKIDRQFKDGEGYNNPLYTEINRSAKGIRDQFEYYVDDAGNLVPPPGYRPVYDAEFVSSKPPPTPPTQSDPNMPSSGPPPSSGGPGSGGAPPAGGGPAPAAPGSGGAAALGPGTLRSIAPEEATPLSLLAGNELAMPAPESVVRGGDTEPLMRPERADEGGMDPELMRGFEEATAGMSPEDIEGLRNRLLAEADRQERLGIRDLTDSEWNERERTGIDPRSRRPGLRAVPDDRGNLERMLDAQLGDPNKSVPIPSDAAWNRDAAGAQQWYEDIVAPGSPARNAEAKRLQDLTEQQQALEEAHGVVGDMDRQVGPIDEKTKERLLIDYISKTIGREVTREDLVKAGLLAGGVAAMASGEEEGGALAAGAGGLGFIGKNKLKLNEIVHRLSEVTDGAVKRLTPKERQAITHWSSSSRHYKEAFERVGMTAEEHANKLKQLGYSEQQIAELNTPPFHSEYDTEATEALGGALRKLSVERPTDYGTLYRGFSAGDSDYGMPDIESLRTKDTFVNRTPISTSFNEAASDDFARGSFIKRGQTPVMLEFKTVNRASPKLHGDIQSLGESARMREAEVIIPPGSTFKVVERKKKQLHAYPEGHKFHDPRDVKEADVIVLEQTDDAPREAWKDAAMIAATIGAGSAVDEATDDEDGVGTAAGAMAGIMGGGRRRKRGKPRTSPPKVPRQLEAMLDDGTKVKGFSALRRKEHEALNLVETARRRMGVGNEKTLANRIAEFNQADNLPQDKALLEEAILAGKERELRQAPAANAYQGLKKKAWFGGDQGFINAVRGAGAIRLEKLFELMSGAPRNPFIRDPEGLLGQLQRQLLEDPARRLMDLSRGRPGALYGNEAEMIYDLLNPERREEEEQR